MSDLNQDAKQGETTMKTEEEEARQDEMTVEEASAEDAQKTAEAASSEGDPAAAEEPVSVAEAAAEAAAPDYTVQMAELENKYLRKLAEFDNYRKRMAREFNDVREQTRRSTVTDFLTVYDYFSMGMSAIKTATDVAVLQQGMDMIWAEFQRVLENMNVKEIGSVGQPFDPNLHEAVSREPSEDVAEGIVLRQWKAGFKMGDKLLRPAMVVVSSGKPVQEAPAPAEEQKSAQEEKPVSDDGTDIQIQP